MPCELQPPAASFALQKLGAKRYTLSSASGSVKVTVRIQEKVFYAKPVPDSCSEMLTPLHLKRDSHHGVSISAKKHGTAAAVELVTELLKL